MHKIFFERRCIILSGKGERCESDENHICIPTEDEMKAYGEFLAGFHEVEAAGGLVSDGKGNYLMIKRSGLWDLPKGHMENGESQAECAIREVQEETGLTGLTIRNYICTTDHCYFRDGKWNLKHTHWYMMTCPAGHKTTPQTAEGITQAIWISAEGIPAHLETSYPSITEVFQKSLIEIH